MNIRTHINRPTLMMLDFDYLEPHRGAETEVTGNLIFAWPWRSAPSLRLVREYGPRLSEIGVTFDAGPFHIVVERVRYRG